MKFIFGLVVMSVYFSGCSATVDEDNPGLCELKCVDSQIASTEARFRVAGPQGTIVNKNITCNGVDFGGGTSAEVLGPVTVQFILERDGIDPDATLGRGGEGDDPTKTPTPLSGIAFEPVIISGAMEGTRSSDENVTKEANGQVDPFKYAGIVTPKSEWCTDTCGVATIEIWPICFQGNTNEVVLQLHSGSVYSDVATITVDHNVAAALNLEEENSDPNLKSEAEVIDESSDISILDE